MEVGRLARFGAGVTAVVAAVTGVCALAAAAYQLFSSASLDLSDTRHWRHVAALAITGFALLGYATAHAALCRRPADRRAVAARAVFAAAGCAVAVLMIRSTLNAPPTPECGMKWLADLAPFLFATGFVTVEAAAWVGWWVGSPRQAEGDAAPAPGGGPAFPGA